MSKHHHTGAHAHHLEHHRGHLTAGEHHSAHGRKDGHADGSEEAEGKDTAKGALHEQAAKLLSEKPPASDKRLAGGGQTPAEKTVKTTGAGQGDKTPDRTTDQSKISKPLVAMLGSQQKPEGNSASFLDLGAPVNLMASDVLATPMFQRAGYTPSGDQQAGTTGDQQSVGARQTGKTGDPQTGKSADQQTANAGDKQAGGGGGPTATESPLDPKKSVAELIQAGVLKDGSADAKAADYQPLKDGQTPKISVVYENKDQNVPSPQPNFIVGKDGQVTVVHNPEGQPPDGNVVIQVQRDAQQTGAPADAQKQAINDLVNYEGQRIVNQYGNALATVQTKDGPVKQVDIDDPQHLVDDKVQQKFGDQIPPEALASGQSAPPAVPPDVQSTSDNMNRVRGSGGHTTVPRESAPGRQPGDPTTPAGIDQMIPAREVPQAPSEPRSEAALKDAEAALFNPDRTHPYDTVRETAGVGYQVGRYGLNQGFSLIGLAEMMGIDLGDPPDLSKLMEYLKQHPDALKSALDKYAHQMEQDADKNHLPADDKLRASAKNLEDLAKKMSDPQFQQGFVKLLSDMKGGGDPVTADRLHQFMPKELQEALASRGVEHLAKQMGADPAKLTDQDAGKIALGMFLGRAPNQEDLNNPQYQQFMSAAGNLYKLAEARQQTFGDIDVSDAQGKIVANANKDLGHALWTKYMNDGNLGCAASVSAVLNQSGFSYANSLSVSGLQDQLLAHGWTVDRQPHPGDVICGYRAPKNSGGGGSAHTGIVGADGSTYANRSSTGRWGPLDMSYWTGGQFRSGVVYLHPPGSSDA